MLTSTSTNRKYQQNSWLSHLSHSHSLTERAWCRHLTASRSRSHPHSSRGTDTHFQVSDSLQQSHGFSCIHYSLAFSSFLPLFLLLYLGLSLVSGISFRRINSALLWYVLLTRLFSLAFLFL